MKKAKGLWKFWQQEAMIALKDFLNQKSVETQTNISLKVNVYE